MIKGIGIDTIEISRIDKAISKSDKFLNRLFSNSELDYLKSRNYNKSTVAGLFSSKEAVSKALGTGIRGFDWKDIEIYRDKLGKPLVKLKGEAFSIAKSKDIEKIYLSISHDREKAITVAIAEGKYEKTEYKLHENNEPMKNIFVKRKSKSHKGTYGRVGIIAGSKGMSGAPFLSSSSALRTGSGLVYTIVPSSISQILEIKSIEAIIKSFDDKGFGHFTGENIEGILDYVSHLDVVAIGPGLSSSLDLVELISIVLKKTEKPVVVDADGLNLLSKNIEVLYDRKHPTVLTPHEAEFKRLIGDVEVNLDLKDNREKIAMEFAKKYNVTLVLKGPQTIVCDGNEIYINHTGNPGMATAGSGDVLTGIIASLIGQGIEVFSATKMAVYLHGLAGDIAKDEKGEYGLIARDIIESIPYAIKKLEGE